MNRECLDHKDLTDFIKERLRCVTEIRDEDEYHRSFATEVLKRHFASNLTQLSAVDGSGEAMISLGVLIHYVNGTQKRGKQANY